MRRLVKSLGIFILICGTVATIILIKSPAIFKNKAANSDATIVRGIFYYPWFPEGWDQQGFNPFTNYHPTLGFYSLNDKETIDKHIAAIRYAHLNTAIASWWGQGSDTDKRINTLLQESDNTGLKWALYYEPEGYSNPSPESIRSDLTYIKNNYTINSNYLYLNNKPVIFVYADEPNDHCNMADRWKSANTVGFYVILKVFPNYQSCSNQPDSWHQYGPAASTDHQNGFSFAISPGFYKKGEQSPRLGRDLNRWKSIIQDMVSSNERLQLIQTFNEWGEGTSVESASEWTTQSGYGAYIDALHNILPDSIISSGNNLTFKIKFQGINSQKNNKLINIVFKQGTNVTNTVNNVQFFPDNNGVYSAYVNGINPGVYDIYIKDEGYLQKKFTNINIVNGNTIDLTSSPLKAGDFDGNNQLDITDLAKILSQYTSLTVLTNTSNSIYDINSDGVIDITDIALVLSNYTALVINGD